jgi:hypothetical protein
LEVSGHLHSPATLPPGNRPRYPVGRRLGGRQSRSGRYGEVEIFYLTGTWTPASPARPARSQSLYRLSYPGSPYPIIYRIYYERNGVRRMVLYTLYVMFTSTFPTTQRGTSVKAKRLRLNKKPGNSTINKTPVRKCLLIQYTQWEHDQRAYHRMSESTKRKPAGCYRGVRITSIPFSRKQHTCNQ